MSYNQEIPLGLEKPEVLNRIYAIQQELKEGLIIEDAGLTAYTKGVNPLSPGCKTCKEGTWLCLFSGYHCNLQCSYCPQKNEGMQDHTKSFVNIWTEDIKTYLSLFGGLHIKGVGYSGGEPFMYLPKILDVANFIKKEKPSIYQWIYTNGLLVTEDSMKEAQDAGISEIRFHISASDFSEEVISKMKKASKIFDKVTTENPSVEKVRDYFVDNSGLRIMEDCGVTQLNLAETYFTNGNGDGYSIDEKYWYNTHFSHAESLIASRFWTYEIIRKAIETKSNITVNDCSNDAKFLQLMKKKMNPILQHIG